jgi:hypothetical protein
MSKRKHKRRLKPRTIWILVVAYFVVGGVIAALFLQQLAAGVKPAGPGEASLNNAWGLFPVVVMLWPVFLIIWLVKALR